MAFESKYTGKQVEELLGKISTIPTKTSQLENDSDYINSERLPCFLDNYAPKDFSNLPIDNITLYWDNGILKAKVGNGEGGEDTDCGCLWELKQDAQGRAYIYSNLPVVTQYGITMYADVGNINLPSLYDGLPIDNSTIYWEEKLDDNGNIIKVLKAKGGIDGTLDDYLFDYLTDNNYAQKSDLPNMSLYVTNDTFNSTIDSLDFVDFNTYETINAIKNFKEGIEINGLGIYNIKDDIIYINSNVAIKGGLTTYTDDGNIDLPSLYAGIPVDGTTITKREDGTLMLNPNLELGGLDEEALQKYLDDYNYAKLSDIPSLDGYAKISDVDSRINDLVNGAPQAYDTLKEIADVLQGNVNSIGDIITTLGTKADKTYVDTELGKYIPIAGDTEVTGIKNFLNGLKVGGLPISKYEGYDDVIYIDANVVLRGGLTQYVVDPATIPSIIESLPQAGYEAKGIASFSDQYFTISTEGKVSIIPDSVGLNEGELIEWLANSDYATKTYVGGQLESYALQSALTATNNTLATKWTQDDDKIANWDTAYSWGNHASAGYALSTEVAVELAKYLPLKGGTINGNLIVEGNISIDSKKTIKIQGGYSILGLTDNVYFVGATNHPTNIKSDGTLTHNNATIWDSNTLTSLSQLTNDADFTTNAYVNETFVTLKGDPQTIEGEKNFTEGLKVNGSPIVYDSEKGYWKLQGNLLITGGLTQYVDDGSVDLPNLYDGLPIDRDTIYWDNGLLKAKVAEGGITSITKDMVVEALGFTPYDATNPNGYITSAALNGYATQTWVNQQGFLTEHQDLSGYQTKITSTNKLAYSLISGTPDLSVYLTTSSASSTYQPKITSSAKLAASLVSGLATVATSGSYNDLSNKPTIPTNTNQLTNGAGFITSAALADYLPLSGGTLTSSTNTPLTLKSTLSESWLSYHNNNGWVASIGVTSSGVLSFYNGVSNKIWHERNDGSGSGLDADLLDGTHKSGLSSYMLGYHTDGKILAANTDLNNVGAGFWGTIDNTAYTNSPFNANFGIISMTLNGTYLGQLALPYTPEHNIRYRNQYYSSGRVWSNWKTLAFTTDNVASATKLQTARTIWGQSFDGTGNVVGDFICQYLRIERFNEINSYTDYANKVSASLHLQYRTNGNATLCYGGGNVGIGTDNPQYKLEVNGDIKFGSKLVWADATNYYIGARSNNAFDYVNWYGHYFKSQGADRMCITREGLVGIGTTSPAYMLDVNGNGRFNKYLAVGASLGQSNTARAQLDLVSPDANPCDLYLGADNTKYWSITTRNNTDATFGGKGLGFYDAVNSTYRMCITQSGNVGIGTTSPSYKLHISHSVGDMIKIQSSTTYACIIYEANAGSSWSVGGNSSNQFYFYNNGATRAYFDGSGNFLATGGITQYSDIRKKTKLQDVELTLKQVANAPLIEHYYNSDDKKTTHVGSIAQYWADMNDWFCKLDSDGFYTMEIQNAALASAISVARELERYESKTDKKIRMLRKRINELEDEIETLKKGA